MKLLTAVDRLPLPLQLEEEVVDVQQIQSVMTVMTVPTISVKADHVKTLWQRMEPRVMMGCTAPQLIHVSQVFAKVREVPVREVPPVMRRPNPAALVLMMQTAMMEHFVTVQRPVILQPDVDRAVIPVLMMGHSVMAMKAVMKTLISV